MKKRGRPSLKFDETISKSTKNLKKRKAAERITELLEKDLKDPEKKEEFLLESLKTTQQGRKSFPSLGDEDLMSTIEFGSMGGRPWNDPELE